MRPLARYIPHFLVISFALWCAYALRGDLAQVSLIAVLRAWDLIALAALLSLLNYALRIIRWRSYLARLGHPLGFRFAALTFIAGFAYTLSPGKVGEMVRARYYAPLGVPLPKTAAAFFAERLLDLVAMVVLAAMLFAGSRDYRGAIIGAAGLVAVALGVFALVPWERLSSGLKAVEGLPALLRKGAVGVTSAFAATRPLLRPAPLLFGFALALGAWGLEGLGLSVLTGMVPAAHVSVPSAVGVYAVAVLIGGLSFLPGGLGSTEAIMTTMLVALGVTLADAILLTLACRIVTLWLAVCLGWAAVLILPKPSFAAASS